MGQSGELEVQAIVDDWLAGRHFIQANPPHRATESETQCVQAIG